jgi:hypothetical protein
MNLFLISVEPPTLRTILFADISVIFTRQQSYTLRKTESLQTENRFHIGFHFNKQQHNEITQINLFHTSLFGRR